MLEINVEETHDNLISLLDKIVQDKDKNLSLPSLASFRASIQIKGKPLSQTVIELRDKERY